MQSTHQKVTAPGDASEADGTGNGNGSNGHDRPAVIDEHIVEIVSDSGEGAQKAGQAFAAISGKMGNGVWTVEIIPAEIKPPARSRAGASGIRVRLGRDAITNMGDEADLVVAFNEQVLYGRIAQNAYKPDTVILLENKWTEDPDPRVREMYASAVAAFRERGYQVRELGFEAACKGLLADARVGKNMFVLGVLCRIYDRDRARADHEVQALFRRKGPEVVATNTALVHAGYEFAERELHDLAFSVPPRAECGEQVVMNGNQAVGLGALAAGIEVVSMYPITPATSVSHYIATVAHKLGACLHQAEDEIAAIGFAIGASYAGKTAMTVTSGPGLALKTEFLGLAVMAEIPLVVVVVQRGGPSTGLPTKVEQGDLLAACFGTPGDAPKVILAPATIEECFHSMITARRLAEAFRTPVLVLTDANLATGMQPFARPRLSRDWLPPPIDQSPWRAGVSPYDWDENTGLSPRPIPGQRGGEYVVTGLAHTSGGKVAYDPDSNQRGCVMRSRKFDALRSTLRPPAIDGPESGDLLIVGWGSTLGAIREAAARARNDGRSVSSVHVRFLWPMEPGLAAIFARFRQVMTVEINYSDPVSDPRVATQDPRPAQLAHLLRAQTLVDIQSWSNVHGQPLQPGPIYREICRRIASLDKLANQEETHHVRAEA